MRDDIRPIEVFEYQLISIEKKIELPNLKKALFCWKNYGVRNNIFKHFILSCAPHINYFQNMESNEAMRFTFKYFLKYHAFRFALRNINRLKLLITISMIRAAIIRVREINYLRQEQRKMDIPQRK